MRKWKRCSIRPGIIVIGLSVQTGGQAQQAILKAGAAMLLTKEAAVDELYQPEQIKGRAEP